MGWLNDISSYPTKLAKKRLRPDNTEKKRQQLRTNP
jgi:hypothetical protein